MIAILTNKLTDLIPNREDIIIINSSVELVDDYHLKWNDNIIEFDYLIAFDQTFVQESNLPFVKDGQQIITNWVGQTSIEHIYIGNFELAIDDLFNN